ncbi:MAG: cupredoxin domain-containing protein [Vicinamibacterales bacterium]
MAKLIASIGIVALVAGALVISARSPAPTEIRLVVRDMTFYLDGQAEPNPTLRLHTGQNIRLVLRNEDEGMTHDFAIPGIGAATRRLEGGEEASIAFRAPDRPGTLPYTCRPHARIMRGTILVE